MSGAILPDKNDSNYEFEVLHNQDPNIDILEFGNPMDNTFQQ